jgi:hypothetical protein
MQSITIFSGAMMAVFASLGLVALSIAYLARRFSRSALVVALVGLLGLTSAATLASLNGTMIGPVAPPKPITPTPGCQKPISTVCPSQNELDQVRAELSAALTRAKEAEQKAASTSLDNEALKFELKEAKEKLNDALKRIAELEPPPLPTTTDALIRSTLRQRRETPFYVSEPIQQGALVADLNGSWYRIQLKVRNKSLTFPGRQFKLSDQREDILESVGNLNKDLFGPVSKVAKQTAIFVRGSADARRIVGSTDAPLNRPISILVIQPDGTYAATTKQQTYKPSVPVRNEDLPNLRAEWLRETVSPVVELSESNKIRILENVPRAEQERTAEFFLFVQW